MSLKSLLMGTFVVVCAVVSLTAMAANKAVSTDTVTNEEPLTPVSRYAVNTTD